MELRSYGNQCEALALRNGTHLTDRDLLAYLRSIADVMHEEFLRLSHVFLVLRMLLVALDGHRAGVLHGALHDDAFEYLPLVGSGFHRIGNTMLSSSSMQCRVLLSP